jgi:replicative DNA helicase
MENVPPHDKEAEEAVLGSILIEEKKLDEVAQLLRPEHFYFRNHGRIFEAFLALGAKNSPIDIVQVGTYLRDKGTLVSIGGMGFLTELLVATPVVSNVLAYAETVYDKARVRSLIEACNLTLARAYQGYGDIGAFLDETEQKVYEVVRGNERSFVEPIQETILGYLRTARASNCDAGLTTRLVSLDSLLGGLYAGELTLIAARPGMGKTALALNIAANVASPNTGAAFFSLEMPKGQLVGRLLCSEAGLDVSLLRRGALSAENWTRLDPVTQRIGTLPLWLDDPSSLNIFELRAKIRRIQAECKRRGTVLRAVFVDYIQLMQSVQKSASREQEVSEISRGLKAIAKDHELAVVALSQLNRAVETRHERNKRPMLSDLRESGALEQDADNIIFIYRDEYYYPETDSPGIAELIVAKQRNGPIGTAKVRFEKEATRFTNL